MNTRRINQALHGVTLLVAIAAALVIILGVLLPTESASTGADARARTDPATKPANAPALAELQPLWDLRLRNELNPSAVAASAAPPAQLASADVSVASDAAPVTLIGTIGDSLAIFRNAGGEVAGVEVVEVRPSRVRVRFNGQERTLEKPREIDGL
jgi:hypothetical protein